MSEMIEGHIGNILIPTGVPYEHRPTAVGAVGAIVSTAIIELGTYSSRLRRLPDVKKAGLTSQPLAAVPPLPEGTLQAVCESIEEKRATSVKEYPPDADWIPQFRPATQGTEI